MSIHKGSSNGTNGGRSSNNVVSASSFSSSDFSSSSSHHEPQQHQAKTPLSPRIPSCPLTPGGSVFRKAMKLSSPKKKPKKVVRFNSCVTARPSLHKNNYTTKETAATWYSADEFEGIRKDVLETLALVRSGNLVEPEDYCYCADDDADVRDDDASTVATSESGSASRKRALQSSGGSYRNTSSKGTTTIYDSKRHREWTVSTSRGLENYTPKGSIKSSIRKARQNAVWAVMEEQDHQVDRAECLKLTYLWYDDEAIREVYRKHSKPALKAARFLGVADSGHGAEPAMMPRRQSLTLYNNSNSNSNSSSTKKTKKKTLRKLFQKSSIGLDEKTLIEKAAVAFPEKSSRHSSSKQQRRWSLLGSGRRGSLSAEGPRNPTALVA